jgi:beta-alanine--pyruvate transaminase
VHAPGRHEGVVSVRNLGLAAGIELAADAGGAGQRGARAQAAAFDRGLLTRAPGDTLILAPPFVSTVVRHAPHGRPRCSQCHPRHRHDRKA